MALAELSDLKRDLDKVAWISNPTFHDPLGMKTTELMILLGGKYFQLPFLMSEKVKLLSPDQSPALQNAIDQAYSKIFSTPTGQKICMVATLGHVPVMIHQFGVSLQFASKWSRHCAPSDAIQSQFRKDTPRSFLLIYTEDENHPAQGWTNSYGVTFLPMLANELTEEHFVRILSHEVAVRFDRKESIGSWYSLEGINLNGASTCEVLNIIRNPIIKYAFVSSRARQVENQIMKELGLPVSALKMSCAKQVQNEIPGIIRLIPLIQPELLITNALAQTKGCERVDINWFQSIYRLEELDLCEYFNNPDIGQTNVSPTVGGPRPRITGGWGDKNIQALEEQSAKLNQWLILPQSDILPHYKKWDENILRKIESIKKPIETPKNPKATGETKP